MSPVRDRRWDGTQLQGGTGELPGWSDPFAGSGLGTVEPIGGVNVGAGFYQDRPFPTATITIGNGVTFNSTAGRYTVAAGVTIENVVIPGFLTLADGALARNVYVKAPPTEKLAGQALVEGPNTLGQGRIEWSTIAPEVASAYYDGIGRGIRAYACDVYDITDGTRGFSTSVNGVRIQCYATEFHHAAQWRPDYATSNRAETHNDVGVQGQGNPNGDDNDLYFEGCRVNARHSLTKGTGSPTRNQIAAIMVTPAASVGAVHLTYKNGWLYGGIFCVNAGSDGVNSFGPSSVVITGNRIERPGTDIFGDGRAPDVALAIDPTLARTISGNVYVDNGAPVPITNA